MSNLETEVRALIEAVEKLSEHQMDDAMFRQWRDGVYPAVERVRGALDGFGEAVGQICDDGLGAYVELHDDYSFAVGQPVYTHPSASVPDDLLEALARKAEDSDINFEAAYDPGYDKPLRHDVDVAERVADWIRAQKGTTPQPADCNNGQSCEHCEPEHGCRPKPKAEEE